MSGAPSRQPRSARARSDIKKYLLDNEEAPVITRRHWAVLIEPTVKSVPVLLAGGWLFVLDPSNRLTSSVGLLIVLAALAYYGLRAGNGRTVSAVLVGLGGFQLYDGLSNTPCSACTRSATAWTSVPTTPSGTAAQRLPSWWAWCCSAARGARARIRPERDSGRGPWSGRALDPHGPHGRRNPGAGERRFAAG